MKFQPDAKQRRLLYRLLAHGGHGRSDGGFAGGPAWAPLIEKRFVEARKIGKATQWTLEDSAWAWLEEHLGNGSRAAPAAGAAKPTEAAVLETLLARAFARLKQDDVRLAEVFGEPIPAPPPHPLLVELAELGGAARLDRLQHKPTAAEAKRLANEGLIAKRKYPKTALLTPAGEREAALPAPTPVKDKRKAGAAVQRHELLAELRRRGGLEPKATAAWKTLRAEGWIEESPGGEMLLLTDAGRARLDDAAPPAEDLAAAIRSACLAINGHERVRLAELRARLPHVPRDRLDAELLRLELARKLVLYRLDFLAEMTAADHAAELTIPSGEKRQLAVWNES